MREQVSDPPLGAFAQRASAVVSGEFGGRGPGSGQAPSFPPETSREGSLLYLRETASSLACKYNRPFTFTVARNGVLTHREELPPGPSRAPLLHRQIKSVNVLFALRKLFASCGFEHLPATIGHGASPTEIEWRGDDVLQSRTLHLNRSGSCRDFGGGEVPRALVDLIDGLCALIDWVDTQTPEPAWPAVPSPGFFPLARDLASGRCAARLSTTHDWDGSTAYRLIRQVMVSGAGILHYRDVSSGGVLPPWQASPDSLSVGEVSAILERLALLKPTKFRSRIGFVNRECELDTTYTDTFDYFDGARVNTCSLIFGFERYIGQSFGDMPPTTAESTAIEELHRLLRLGR